MTSPLWITPDWPAPRNVRAAVSLRAGGVSVGSYASLNLGTHVGDDPAAVAENRRRLRAALQSPGEPLWLSQVHGVQVHRAGFGEPVEPPTADASVAFEPERVCTVLTADCLPVLLCDREGTRVGAAHAGWRGLVGGVLKETVAALDAKPASLMAWLGPAIEQDAFEVGPEVREQFVERCPENEAAFIENARGRWQADIYDLARRELRRLGLTDIHGGGFRCFADRDRFFSYRRDGQTGRMATMVWLA